jgi:hypothetical protein
MRGVKWDALAFCCPGERTLMILLNPAKAETRQTATLMEEFSHHLLGREPCKIAINPNTGLLERSYDKAQEHEAELAALPGLLPALQPSTPPRRVAPTELRLRRAPLPASRPATARLSPAD